MELAGVQAVCDFYGWELYDFLVTGDVLDQAVYDVSGFAHANHGMEKLYIAIGKPDIKKYIGQGSKNRSDFTAWAIFSVSEVFYNHFLLC